MITSIIVEDEYPARLRLGTLLRAYQDKVDNIASVGTGREAINVINLHRPQLIFLDIHLPDMNGFDVLHSIDYQPFVIFTTGYHDYALKAFEVYSVDYLLKPFDEQRFGLAMNKLINLSSDKSLLSPDFQKLEMAFLSMQTKPSQTSIAVKSGNKIVLIDYEDICHLKADDKYVTMFMSDGKSYFCDKSLTKIADELPQNFIRIHRSHIINKNWIAEIHRYFKGRYMIVIDDSVRTTIVTSDTYTKNVKSSLGL